MQPWVALDCGPSGAAVGVVGEEAVVDRDAVGAGAGEPAHAVGTAALGDEGPLEGEVPHLAPGVDVLVGGAHEGAVVHQDPLDGAALVAPEEEAIA